MRLDAPRALQLVFLALQFDFRISFFLRLPCHANFKVQRINEVRRGIAAALNWDALFEKYVLEQLTRPFSSYQI